MMKSESCSAARSVDVVMRDLISEATESVMRLFDVFFRGGVCCVLAPLLFSFPNSESNILVIWNAEYSSTINGQGLATTNS